MNEPGQPPQECSGASNERSALIAATTGPGHSAVSPHGVLITLVAAVCLLLVCGTTIGDPDLWGHTLYGLRAIDQGVLAETTDPFSYTAAGHEWRNHEWLTEYQFGWLWQQLGNGGLVLWRNVLACVVFAIGLLALRRSCASLGAAVLLLVFNAECLVEFMVYVRPQMATFACFAVTLFLLRRWWDAPRLQTICLLPACMAVWTNMHGGFIAGLGIQFLFVAAACLRSRTQPRWRSHSRWLLAVFGASLLATLANPYGWHLHEMLWHHLREAQPVREWQSLLSAPQSPVLYLPLVLLALTMLRPSSLRGIDVLVLAVVALQAVLHLRHVALLSIATLVLLPGPLSQSLNHVFQDMAERLSGERSRWTRMATTGLVCVLLLLINIAGSMGRWAAGIGPFDIAVDTRRDVPGMPMHAVSLIQQTGRPANLLTDYGWGQYCIWHLYPQCRIAFDGRYRTVYGRELERQYFDFHRASETRPTSLPMLDEHPTDLVLLPVNRGPVEYLDARAGWSLVAEDGQSRLYARTGSTLANELRRLAADPVPAVRWVSFPGMEAGGTAVAKVPHHHQWVADLRPDHD